MRLQKFLSRAGIASRRKSERLITEGRVSVDGAVVTRLGTSVDPEVQSVQVDGRPVCLPPLRWLAVHKPPGYECTRRDPAGRPTIYDLVPEDARHLFHVGRLDYMSEGLVLLSNEGDLAHRVLHPRSGVERRYRVTLVGPVAEDLPERLRAGVALEDGPAVAISADWVAPPRGAAPVIEIVIAEGRNREIRRMLAALGTKIRRLKRVAVGPISLGTLPAGNARWLTDDERRALQAVVDRDRADRPGESR